MQQKNQSSFNQRAFVSVAMFVSGILLPISGIVNHSMQFDPFTPARHFWMSVHNMSASLFVIMVVIHLYYNFRSLMNHVKKLQSIRIRREALVALVFVLAVVGLFSYHAFAVAGH